MPLLKLQLKKSNEQNHKRALGAREGVPSEDATWEEENILKNPNLKFIEDKKYWVGRTVMSPFK